MTDMKFILVVEDDPVLKNLLGHTFAGKYQTLYASDGNEALALFESLCARANPLGLLPEQVIIRAVGRRRPGRGRSQIVVELNAMARYVLGAPLEDRACTVVLALACGSAATRSEVPRKNLLNTSS